MSFSSKLLSSPLDKETTYDLERVEKYIIALLGFSNEADSLIHEFEFAENCMRVGCFRNWSGDSASLQKREVLLCSAKAKMKAAREEADKIKHLLEKSPKLIFEILNNKELMKLIPKEELLFVAIEIKAYEFIVHLLQRFPDNIVNKYQKYRGIGEKLCTPLHMACKINNGKLIKLFIEHGANPNAKTANGKTPLDYLNLNESPSPRGKRALLNTGAKQSVRVHAVIRSVNSSISTDPEQKETKLVTITNSSSSSMSVTRASLFSSTSSANTIINSQASLSLASSSSTSVSSHSSKKSRK